MSGKSIYIIRLLSKLMEGIHVEHLEQLWPTHMVTIMITVVWLKYQHFTKLYRRVSCLQRLSTIPNSFCAWV